MNMSENDDYKDFIKKEFKKEWPIDEVKEVTEEEEDSLKELPQDLPNIKEEEDEGVDAGEDIPEKDSDKYGI